MDKITKLTLLVMIVLFVVLVQTVQLTLIAKEKSIAGLVIASGPVAGTNSASASIDTSQMTENEKMNYEMHGVIPARFGGGSQQASGVQGLPQMVGGC